MRGHEVVVRAAEGADDDEGETAGVDGISGCGCRGEGFDDGFAGVGVWRSLRCQQVFSCGEDAVVGDEGLSIYALAGLVCCRKHRATYAFAANAVADDVGGF